MRLMKALLGAAVALLGACGGKDGVQGPAGEKGADGAQGDTGEQGLPGMPGTPAATDGSRLKARWVTGSDGSKGFFGWLDSELGRPCAFVDTAAGLRCAPAAAITAPVWAPFDNEAPAIAFRDAACSEPAIAIQGSSPSAGTIVWYALAGEPPSIGLVGAAVAAGTDLYAFDQAGPAGQCVFQMVAGSFGLTALELGDVTSQLVGGVVAP